MSALRRLVFWPSFVLLLPQALWIRRTAPRFEPGAGPPHGQVGRSDQPLRLLAIGDSIVDAVGAPTVADGLPGQLAVALHQATSRSVAWEAIGCSGIDIAGVIAGQLPVVPQTDYDAIVVSVGVNDVTGLTLTRHWRARVARLLRQLNECSPRALIVLCGLPPLHGFPLLPQPLRWVLGQRARILDSIGAEVAGQAANCIHVATAFEPSPEQFAADGYHPNPDSCRRWASELAHHITLQLAQPRF